MKQIKPFIFLPDARTKQANVSEITGKLFSLAVNASGAAGVFRVDAADDVHFRFAIQVQINVGLISRVYVSHAVNSRGDGPGLSCGAIANFERSSGILGNRIRIPGDEQLISSLLNL